MTDNGPQPLTSATIVVDLDPRVSGAVNPPPTCSVDTGAATLTCFFGSLATGATAASATEECRYSNRYPGSTPKPYLLFC